MRFAKGHLASLLHICEGCGVPGQPLILCWDRKLVRLSVIDLSTLCSATETMEIVICWALFGEQDEPGIREVLLSESRIAEGRTSWPTAEAQMFGMRSAICAQSFRDLALMPVATCSNSEGKAAPLMLSRFECKN